MSRRSALVVGASRGLGRGVATTLAANDFAVTALARNENELLALEAASGIKPLVADATSANGARHALRETNPDLLVIVAGASPVLRPLHEHTWETFSTNWEVDTRIAFEWLSAALTMPLSRGAHVIVFSSGAGIAGSPLSGGYAGAKRMQWFLTDYAAAESRRLDLGLQFHCLVPMLSPSTELGRAAIAAYAVRLETPEAEYASRFSPFLTPAIAGEAVAKLAQAPSSFPDLAYRLGGHGLRPVG